jgi:PKD repeat protein
MDTGGGGGGSHASASRTGGTGGNGVILLQYDVIDTPLNASFSVNTTGGTAPVAVLFTDTSAGTIVTRNWTFRNTTGNNTPVVFSAVQNPIQTFNQGNYSISLNITNATTYAVSSQTTWINVSPYVPSGSNPLDILMDGAYVQTFHITDSSTGEPIPVVNLLDNSGVSYTTTNGTGYLTEAGGAYAVYFTSTGYSGHSVSYVADADESHDVQLVKSSTAIAGTNIIYTQRQVRIRVVDLYGKALTPVTLTASYKASSLPSGGQTSTEFLQQAFGVSAAVAADMQDSSLAMTAVTGRDGSNTFTMFPSLTYNITMVNTTMGVACMQDLSPQDTDYMLYCPTGAQAAANVAVPLAQQLNRSYVWITEPNASYVKINSQYQDLLGKTTNVKFNVTCVDNNTQLYYVNLGNPGILPVYANYTIYNTRGMQLNAYLTYDRSA